MLVTCSNPNCSVQFSYDLRVCPACKTAIDPGTNPVQKRQLQSKRRAVGGRLLLLFTFISQLAIAAIVIFVVLDLNNQLRLLNGSAATVIAVVFVLNIVLMIGVYVGNNAARTLLALVVFAGLCKDRWLFLSTDKPILLVSFGYSIFTLYVVRFSPSVSEFLKRQRREQ